jgi:hypothetical protein
MPDLSSVPALLISIKNASDIVKALRNVNVSLEDAEHKLQLANLIESLAEAKMRAAEIQDVIREKDEEIKRLNDALALKSTIIKHGDAYYEMDDDGKPKGSKPSIISYSLCKQLI